MELKALAGAGMVEAQEMRVQGLAVQMAEQSR